MGISPQRQAIVFVRCTEKTEVNPIQHIDVAAMRVNSRLSLSYALLQKRAVVVVFKNPYRSFAEVVERRLGRIALCEVAPGQKACTNKLREALVGASLGSRE